MSSASLKYDVADIQKSHDSVPEPWTEFPEYL